MFNLVFISIKSNYNIITMEPCHMILLVIIFNNISLSLLIAFIYHFISDSLFLNILNLIYLLLKISFSLLYCWNIFARYYIIEKFTSLSSYRNFDIYLSISYLLRYNLFWLDFVKDLTFFIILYNCKLMTELFYSQSQP